jgi:hypothetical protein
MFEQSRGHGCRPDHGGNVTGRKAIRPYRLSFGEAETWVLQTVTLNAQKAMRSASKARPT